MEWTGLALLVLVGIGIISTGLPAAVVLLWRARLGVASVLAMLDATLPFRRLLIDQIGLGRAALR